MKKLILTGVLMVLFLIPAEAQVLKNLKKKVDHRVEQKVTDKIADKAASEAGKSVDKAMEPGYNNSGFPMGAAQADLSEVPEIYEFEWRYVMKMENKEGETNLNYFLKKDAPYFGFELPNSGEMFMVMDQSRNLMVNYMNSKGTKMITASKISKSALDETEDKKERDETTFKKIDGKTIMGYKCRGFQAENKDGVYTFYITSEPDISFMDIYKSDKTKLPANFDPNWIEDGKGLTMQMILEDKKNAKNNLVMTCVTLEKQSVILRKSDYKSLAGY
jgi:hypothetical protein